MSEEDVHPPLQSDEPYVVAQEGHHWVIHCAGRDFDRFDAQEQALQVAISWAENARRQGRNTTVLLDIGGSSQVVWPQPGSS